MIRISARQGQNMLSVGMAFITIALILKTI
jgi:hypothetical protein